MTDRENAGSEASRRSRVRRGAPLVAHPRIAVSGQ
jgi:hypothetical protein